MKIVYIVMCCLPLVPIKEGSSILFGNDEPYHIDSVWASERKAKKRKDELNSDAKAEWHEDYGYGLFNIEQEFIST